MKVSRSLAAAGVAAIAALVPAVPAMAKGGSSSSIPTTPGPCSTSWVIEPGYVHYPLSNPAYPGAVSVDLDTSGATPAAQSICLDPGWTVRVRSTTDGVSLKFSYDGRAVLDFKFVAGKTTVLGR